MATCIAAWNMMTIGDFACTFFCSSMYISLRLAGSASALAALVISFSSAGTAQPFRQVVVGW